MTQAASKIAPARALMGGASRTAILALSSAMALGVSLAAGPANAGTVSPVQSTTYALTSDNNPITFGSGTRLTVPAAEAVYGSAGTGWTVTNQGGIRGLGEGILLESQSTLTNSGSIQATGANGYGVALLQGGAVANQAGGVIHGSETGLYIGGAAGTVTNAGSIGGGKYFDVILVNGGTVANLASGVIAGAVNGVRISGGAGAVTNAGQIVGGSDDSTGVFLTASGSVTNQSGGTISGSAGVFVLNGGSVSNAGLIEGANYAGVAILVGSVTRAGVTNLAGGTIVGYAQGVYSFGAAVTNAGVITATGAKGVGVDLFKGASFTNQAGGTVSGQIGVSASIASVTVVNAGSIYGVRYGVGLRDSGVVTNQAGATINGGDYGVGIYRGGTVTNAGVIKGRNAVSTGAYGAAAAGVGIDGAGVVTNLAGGTVSGGNYGVGVLGAGTVTNAGLIVATNTASTGPFGFGAAGVIMVGGAVVNQAGGTISGALRGVVVLGGGTVVNAGAISGATAVEFAGPGANLLELRGGSSLVGAVLGSTGSGATNALVLQGAGAADNNFSNFTSLDVLPGAAWVLGGASSLGAIAVESGGLLQIGDTAHPTATVAGTSLTLNSGSTLAFTLAPTAGVNSAINLSGAASLAGTLDLVAAPGIYRKGMSYTLITAGSIGGAFTAIDASQNLTFSVSDPPQSLVATVVKGSFAPIGATPNQTAVGNALVSVPVGATDFDTVANAAVGLAPGVQQNAALDELGGEIDADFLTVARDSARSFLDGIGDQLSAAGEAHGPGGDDRDPWVRAYGSLGTLDGDADAHGFTNTSGGAIAGASRGWGGAVVGAAITYGHTDLQLRNLSQKGSFDTGAIALYGEERSGVFFLDAAGSIAYDHGQSTRTILFPGIARQPTGGLDGYAGSALLSAGARMDGGDGFLFEPSLNLIYSHVEQDSFGEKGGGGADLDIDGKSQDALESTLQAKVSKPVTLADGNVLRTDIKVAWAHEWSPTGTSITEAFQAPGGNPFTLAGATPDRDFGIVGAGLAYDASKRLTYYARYQAAIGQHETDNAVSAGFKFSW